MSEPTRNRGVDPTDSRRIGTCPDCGSELEPVGIDGEDAVRAIEQACVSDGCDGQYDVASCWFGPTSYVVLAPACDGDSCTWGTCDDEAVVRSRSTDDSRTRARCERHLEAHLERTCRDGGLDQLFS